MSVVAPNLGSLPDEVLVQIFARLLHVPSKVRLERVSRKFLRCISKQESWKYNTQLSLKEYEHSMPALRSFLRHTAVITRLIFDQVVTAPPMLAALWEFSHKLEVRHFRYLVTNNCPNNGMVLAILANFSSSLTQLVFFDCGLQQCGTRDTLLHVLPSLDNLHTLTFALFRSQHEMGPAIHNAVFGSLQKLKSLRILQFFNCDNLDAQRLASVFNQNECIGFLRVQKGRVTRQLHFPLTDFCRRLSKTAARSLRTIKLEEMQIEWTNTLPSVPTFFPNLNHLLLKVDGQNNAVQMAGALGGFLRAGQGNNKNKRKVPLTLELEVSSNGTFGEELWAAVDLIEIVKSGTKRTQDMTKWNRKFKNGNISISASVKPVQNIGE